MNVSINHMLQPAILFVIELLMLNRILNYPEQIYKIDGEQISVLIFI